MNITFLIGNGFDINLGLNTQYAKFYPYYLAKKHDDIIYQAISANYRHWGDLELALSQILNGVKADQIDEFLDGKGRLENDLAEYLLTETRRINVSNPELAKEFQKQVVHFYREFKEGERKEYTAWISNFVGQLRYQFISFNYTEILDSIVEDASNIASFSSHNALNMKFDDWLGNVIHIHGTLSEDIILGIDNAQQITNSQLRNDTALTDYIIKKNVNQALEETRVEKAIQVIEASKYVCIYGMSLGDTDLFWWQYILRWLQDGVDRRLVLYVHCDSYSYHSASERLRQIKRWKELFLSKDNLDQAIKNQIREQIIVVVNSSIFDFKNIELLDL